ncbi:MAG: hypothetical protein C0624_02775 [Desulfuromonas sp.]|nr:MAG: hypothetical protein C0624_02775 [Desulfuromonas sp.]
MDRMSLRNIILEHQLLPEGRLRELEALSISSGEGLLETVLRGGHLREEVLLPRVGAYLGLEWQSQENYTEGLDAAFYQELPAEVKTLETLLPVRRQGEEAVQVLVADPAQVDMFDQLQNRFGWDARLILASTAQLQKIRTLLENEGALQGALEEVGSARLDDAALEELANEAPIIRLVNLIIMQAISEGGSDVHLEPYEEHAVVRYRVDGVLREVSSYPMQQYPALVSRIKIMANLDIAERRIPQDGRITIKILDREYDLRVASIPLLHGEGVVMRILDKGSINKSLDQLGFSADLLAAMQGQLHRPHGIFLVTGPTGSGKTTTLYAALASILSPESKIITVEDPVEYHLDGISQIHVNPKVGLSFAAGLRSVLRLDPDIIMVGEIRDTETAEIAVRAALTGHLVFSTLHTNDAVSAAARLVDMGIPPYLLASSLNGILAQRLVRKLCEFCKEETSPDETLKGMFQAAGKTAPEVVWRAHGCDECSGSGYQGRVGVYELLEVDAALAALISRNASSEEVRSCFTGRGGQLLHEAGLDKIAAGLSTEEEVLRITQSE